MKIIVCSMCYNEREMLPFYLRHYETIADEIRVWDDHSDDGSRELLTKHPLVRMFDWNEGNGISEDTFLHFAHETYPSFAGQFDWMIWPDIDEFVYHRDLKVELASALSHRYKILATSGYTMMHEGVPEDDGQSQIWQLAPRGIYSKVYSKPIVFQPDSRIQWIRGKHGVENTPTDPVDIGLKLLHYRYLGAEYTKARHARNFSRCGLKDGDKAAAWTCSTDWKGDYSPEWVANVFSTAEPVI